MNMEMIIRRFAGGFVLASLLLAQYHSRYWLWLTAFVGFNLFQSSFTGFCPLGISLSRLGVSGSGCAVEGKTGSDGWQKLKQPRTFLWALGAAAIIFL